MKTEITTSETRHLRGDLIGVVKILKGLQETTIKNFFTLSNTHNMGGRKGIHACNKN